MSNPSNCPACLLHRSDSLFTFIGTLRRINSSVRHTCMDDDDIDMLLKEIDQTVREENKETNETNERTTSFRPLTLMKALNIPLTTIDIGEPWCSLEFQATFKPNNTIYSSWRSILKVITSGQGYVRSGNYLVSDDKNIRIIARVELVNRIDLEDFKVMLEKKTDSKISNFMDKFQLFSDKN